MVTLDRRFDRDITGVNYEELPSVRSHREGYATEPATRVKYEAIPYISQT